jgi:hypothetical protein
VDTSVALFNYEEVYSVIEASGVVEAYIAGHDHEGGYFRDKKGD